MFLSEWFEFPLAPCLAGRKTWWQLASRCCWNRARSLHASELVSFLVGLRNYRHPGIYRTAMYEVRVTCFMWLSFRKFSNLLANCALFDLRMWSKDKMVKSDVINSFCRFSFGSGRRARKSFWFIDNWIRVPNLSSDFLYVIALEAIPL